MVPDRAAVLRELKGFIATELLDGNEIGLDENTPLLEWGLIDSMSIIRLLNFLREKFGVEFPPSEQTGARFRTMGVLTDAVLARLSQS